MQWKGGDSMLILNAPVDLDSLFGKWEVDQHRSPEEEINYPFGLGFAYAKSDIPHLANALHTHLIEEGLFWLAYPKKSSKKYKSDITRDSGWEVLGRLGYEPVRMIAIDADWSAIRFRKVEFISKLTRNKKMRLTK